MKFAPRLASLALAALTCLASTVSLQAVDLYATGFDNGTQKPVFGKIDSSSGVYTQLNSDTGNGFDFNLGLAWNTVSNKFNTLTGPGLLNTITTAGVVGVGISTSSSSALLAYNTNSSTMYVANGNQFGTMNTSTGTIANIGNPNVTAVNSMAFIGGSLYGIVSTGLIVSDSSYGSFDLNTGAFTAITTNTGLYAGMLLAYDGSILYGYQSSNLYSINPSNGAATLLTAVTGAPPIFAISAIPVPEPSTYALGAIAAGVMAAIARRRKRLAA